MSYSTKGTTAELAFTAPVSIGADGPAAKRVQEWLTFHNFKLKIDGDFGPATQAAVKKFQSAHGLPASGTVDLSTWSLLTAPLRHLLDFILDESLSFDQAVLAVANAHLRAHPVEIGGQNRGPWVRAYSGGEDGDDYLWCAYFVTFVMKQAAFLTGKPLPIPGSASCDTLADQARNQHLLVSGAHGNAPAWPDGACRIFLLWQGEHDRFHTGFAIAREGEHSFSTIEGNSDHDGSSNGYEVCIHTRAITGHVEFIKLH